MFEIINNIKYIPSKFYLELLFLAYINERIMLFLHI